jgi:phosphoenolpyruvate synthase/pyruvate phosphate dikinase
MPSEVASEIATAYAALGRRVGRDEPPVAVRSSAVAEDSADASFAGVQDTYLWLRGLEEVLRGVQRCWASYFNPEATAYRAQHASARTGMSVAVQFMVDARVAGVMFTLNPVSGDPSSIAIDASYGLGTPVVGGEVTPDSYLVSKVTREVVRSVVGAKEIECVAAASGDGTELVSVDPTAARGCASSRPRSPRSSSWRGRSKPTTAVTRISSGRSTAGSARSSCSRAGRRRSGARNAAHQRPVAPDALSAIAATFLRGSQRDRQQ